MFSNGLTIVQKKKGKSFLTIVQRLFNDCSTVINMYIKYFKRLIDIVLSLTALILLSPLLLLLVLAIKVDSPGPVLFKQKRVGIHKSHFHILKFRTMRIDTPKDTPTHLLDNPDQWITKIGKLLRKTSLDELPQIINIFKGEMRRGHAKEIPI